MVTSNVVNIKDSIIDEGWLLLIIINEDWLCEWQYYYCNEDNVWRQWQYWMISNEDNIINDMCKMKVIVIQCNNVY